jgi:hypothetical protein
MDMGFGLELVVVTNFNLVGIAINELEANPPLIIDGNGVLAFPISAKRVQTIPAGNS